MHKGVVPYRYRVNTVTLPLGHAGEPAYRKWQRASWGCREEEKCALDKQPGFCQPCATFSKACTGRTI